MDQFDKREYQTVILAALLHDVGKFAERAGVVSSDDPQKIWQEYLYGHAHMTAKVLEELFGDVVHQRIPGSTGDGETLCNLAARHHKPRTMLEKIIQQADWIAAGHERRPTDDEAKEYKTVGRERKSQVPLTSILGRVNPDQGSDQRPDRYYRLMSVPLNSEEDDFQDFFPKNAAEYPAEEVKKDYPKLWADFSQPITSVQRSQSNASMPDVDTLIEIYRQYLWCLPESTQRKDLADVSLFEHSKGTAAVAACLYVWHKENQLFTEEALNYNTKERFLFFCGDIAGIQKFIYQISSKGAYKLLKGRSFLVQALCEVLARHLVRELGFSTANILYVGGGKFYLLLPNTPSIISFLQSEMKRFNRDLLMKYRGDLFLRHGWEKLSSADLTRQRGRTLSRIWDDLTRRLSVQDRHRYADQDLAVQKRLFSVRDYSGEGSCPVCHATTTAEDEVCHTCRYLKDFGRTLGRARYLLAGPKDSFNADGGIELPLGYRIWPLNDPPDAIADKALTLWSINSDDYIRQAQRRDILGKCSFAPLVLGSNQAFDKEFDQIAALSKGIERLGLLRMDVDNLGKIFSKGLRHYQHAEITGKAAERFHSLGRVTTLSWQLGYFFSRVLPTIIETDRAFADRVGVVYSGGDDLFIVGSWDALPELALTIKQKFTDFCCSNPVFTLSGGLVLTDGKFPIYKGAELAGEAEDQAKHHKTKRLDAGRLVETKKAAFTFMGTPMHWTEFDRLKQQKDVLIPLLADKTNHPLLTQLRRIAASWNESRRELTAGGTLPMDLIAKQLSGEKWRWQMVYSLARYRERRHIDEEVLTNLQSFILESVGTVRTGIELLGVLVRWCEYFQRS